MGGHQAGEIAADLAVAQLAAALAGSHGDPDGQVVVDALERANAEIRQGAQTHPELLGMGTTCTVMVIGEVVTVAHVGDSRAYRSRDGELLQLTEDHSLVAGLVRDGRLPPEAAATDARRHVITRALGADDEVRVDHVTVDRRPGDRFLLSTDGLHGQVDDATIGTVLAETPDPAAVADRLVSLADAAGGEDNVTVIVIDPDRLAGMTAPRMPVAVAEPEATVATKRWTAAELATPSRSRRRRAGRLVILVVVAGSLVGAAAWLATGGLGSGVPSPSVAAPSIPAPSASASFGPSPSVVTSPATSAPAGGASIAPSASPR